MSTNRAEARRSLLRRLIHRRLVASQQHAVQLLVERGHEVTQATVSRDLKAIGAAKTRDNGSSHYVVLDPSEPGHASQHELARLMREFVVDVEHSGNLALIKTAAGSAGTVASGLDRSEPAGVVGTVAGDNTVLVVARELDGGAELAERFRKLMETA